MIYGRHITDVMSAGIYLRIMRNCIKCIMMCIENAIKRAVHRKMLPEIMVYMVTALIIINSSATAIVNAAVSNLRNCVMGFFSIGNCFINLSPFLLIHAD